MYRKIMGFVFRILTKYMNASAERAFWLVVEATAQHKSIVVSLLLLGLIIGFLEGAALALIAISVLIITGENTDCVNFIYKLLDFVGSDLCRDFDKNDIFIVLLFLAVVLQVLKAAIEFCSTVAGAYLHSKVVYLLQSKVVRHMMRLDYLEISQYSAGEKQTFFAHAVRVAGLVTTINQIIVTCSVLFGYFALLILMNWKLSIFSFFILATILISIFPVLKKLQKIGVKITQAAIALAKQSIDYLQSTRLIRLYGKDNLVMDIIKERIWDAARLRREGTIVFGILPPLQETIIILTGVCVLAVGYYSDASPVHAELPILLAYVFALHRCGGRLSQLNGIRAGIAKSLPAAEFVAEFLRRDNKKMLRTEGELVPTDWEKIVLENVRFKYPGHSDYVVDGISLTINRGEVIAVVGMSGSGKSTLIDLVSALNDPTSGTVKIDNMDSLTVLPDSWFKLFSVVSQNDLILNRTVRQNLLFVNSSSSNAMMERACKIANAHDFIMEMDNGYQSELGERGNKISGGQVQRIALARAILKDSPVLILDEATSALDAVTERKIIKAIGELENKTLLMIAHRLSTIIHADKIIVMEHGKIVDIGSHNELRKKAGIYKSMWDMQSANEK